MLLGEEEEGSRREDLGERIGVAVGDILVIVADERDEIRGNKTLSRVFGPELHGTGKKIDPSESTLLTK